MCLLSRWMASFVSTQELSTPFRLYTQQKMCIYYLGDCLQPQVLLFGVRRVRFSCFFVFVIHLMVSVVSNLHLSCTQILRRKTTAKTHLQLKEKDFFLSSYGRAEEKKVLIFSLRSHSVLLLTLLLADLCCTKPYWLLLFFVGIKKKMLRRFFTSLSFVISLLLSNP